MSNGACRGRLQDTLPVTSLKYSKRLASGSAKYSKRATNYGGRNVMSRIRMSDDQWLAAIRECRASGLSDRDWCATQGMHTATFYRAIRRLRNKACSIPARNQKAASLPQEVVEIASVDESGIITQISHAEPDSTLETGRHLISFDPKPTDVMSESTARIIMPSGIKVELTNAADAATIRNILCGLQTI